MIRRLDKTYACYAFLGLGILALQGFSAIFPGERGALILVFPFFLLPLSMVVAFVASIVLTVLSWRHITLVVLSVFQVLTMVGVVLAPASVDSPRGNRLLLSYEVVCILVPIWWFSVGRWDKKKSLGCD